MTGILPKRPHLRLDPQSYKELCQRVMQRDNWKCQVCGSSQDLQAITNNCAVNRVRIQLDYPVRQLP